MEAENNRFNAKVCIEFLHREGAHVLRVVVNATHIGEPQFVEPQTTEPVWRPHLRYG